MAPEQDKPARQPVTGHAPGRLELVRAFVNTLDIEAGTDELSSAALLAAWLRERDLIGSGQSSASDHDLRQAIVMREALRDVLLTHVPGHHAPATGAAASGPSASALAELRSAAAGWPTRLTVTDDGAMRVAPAGQGPAEGLAGLMLIAAEAATSGTWNRLKVCSADDCRWAFYDRSPTRSGCWCSMAVCGSRAKSRAFRRRRRPVSGDPVPTGRDREAGSAAS
jgi:predicted RNA-binding Zn ribbon-like protein